MAFSIVSIIAIVGVVLSIIELGLSGWLVSVSVGWWGTPGFYDARANFMVFASVWSLLVLAYIGLSTTILPRIYHRIATLALEAITMIFWFAGSIALAVLAPPTACGANHYCDTLKAAVAFGFFLWLTFLALMILDIMGVMRGRNSHVGKPTTYPQQYV